MENENAGGHLRDPVSQKAVPLTMKGLLCHMEEVGNASVGNEEPIKAFVTRRKCREISDEWINGLFH